MQDVEELMATAAEEFVTLLIRRLAARIFTTEDSVLYTFFAALLHVGIAPEQVILEKPYPNLPDERLDMLLCGRDGLPQAAMEFKYSREIPSGKSAASTRSAGQLLRDCRRLLAWPDAVARYFVLISTPKLGGYLGRRLAPIFSLAPGETLDLDAPFFTGMAPTFHKHMGIWPGNATLRGITNAPLPGDHHVWIFTAHPGTGAR